MKSIIIKTLSITLFIFGFTARGVPVDVSSSAFTSITSTLSTLTIKLNPMLARFLAEIVTFNGPAIAGGENVTFSGTIIDIYATATQQTDYDKEVFHTHFENFLSGEHRARRHDLNKRGFEEIDCINTIDSSFNVTPDQALHVAAAMQKRKGKCAAHQFEGDDVCVPCVCLGGVGVDVCTFQGHNGPTVVDAVNVASIAEQIWLHMSFPSLYGECEGFGEYLYGEARWSDDHTWGVRIQKQGC